jgi:hypothetical protein
MEVITTRYEQLFTVELLHSGYVFFGQNLIHQGLRIVPDSHTKKLFNNHNIRYRFVNGVLQCFMQCDLLSPPATTPVIPFIDFNGAIHLRFLVFSTSDFLSRTQIIAAGSQEVYQFSNQNNAGTNGFIAQHETGVNDDDLQDTSTAAPSEKCFAVIDIHNTGAINASYDLFGGDNRLLSPAYRIRFIPNP